MLGKCGNKIDEAILVEQKGLLAHLSEEVFADLNILLARLNSEKVDKCAFEVGFRHLVIHSCILAENSVK